MLCCLLLPAAELLPALPAVCCYLPSPRQQFISQHPACCAQGESLPMRGTIGQLQERLAAAGVGHRPVIFVCHRCARIGSWSFRTCLHT